MYLQDKPEPKPAQPEAQGIKTKMQLLSEQQILRSMLATVIAAKADPDLEAAAKPFADNICRHFVLLFASGLKAPLPALPSTACQ